MSNTAGVFLALLSIFVFGFLGYVVGSAHGLQLIGACEKELPRSQHCELYAKPGAHSNE